jgi:hypothetical protein
MWQLNMTNAIGEWVDGGTFKTVTDAARRICEIEGGVRGGIFLRMLVEIDHGSDDDAFGHLEHKGELSSYVIKRRVMES